MLLTAVAMGDGRSSPTVLVIEDDAPTAEMFTYMLAAEGLTPIVSFDGHDAVALANEHHPQLVVLDLMLPGLYGTAVAEALKKNWPQLPIIIVSALTDTAVAQDAWRSRAFAYFTKPFEVEGFLAAVHRALRKPEMDYWVGEEQQPEGPDQPAA